MLWYNSPESVKAIRDGQYETNRGTNRRLMRLVRTDGISVE
jgi:hypothetical protein